MQIKLLTIGNSGSCFSSPIADHSELSTRLLPLFAKCRLCEGRALSVRRRAWARMFGITPSAPESFVVIVTCRCRQNLPSPPLRERLLQPDIYYHDWNRF